jgi:hypothetical protein
MNVSISVMSAISRRQIQVARPAARRRTMQNGVDYGLPLEQFAFGDF